MPTAKPTEPNPLHGLTIANDADDFRRPELGRLSDQRLAECTAEVIGVPRAHVADGQHSFVLHTPLELMARNALLPYVATVGRKQARHRIIALAAGYQSSGPPLPEPPARSYDSLFHAASALSEGIEGQDLEGVDLAAGWLGPRLRSDQVVALPDHIVDRLSAAGHGNVYLQLLSRNHPRGFPNQMLRPLVRALAVASSQRIDVPDDRVSGEHQQASTEALLDVLTRVPVIGPAKHYGIAALVDHARAGDALRDLVDADGRFTSPREPPVEPLRFAAQAMLQGPAESSPYGWTHCLTLSQAALMVGAVCESPSRAIYVGAAYLAAHWATLGEGAVDLDRVPGPVDVGLGRRWRQPRSGLRPRRGTIRRVPTRPPSSPPLPPRRTTPTASSTPWRVSMPPRPTTRTAPSTSPRPPTSTPGGSSIRTPPTR